MGAKKPFSSLTSYSVQPVINITIMALIVIGGIGFFTWEDIKNNKGHFKKYRMQSKVILTVTGALILLSAIYFYFFEFSQMPFAQRVWTSLFQSVLFCLKQPLQLVQSDCHLGLHLNLE